MSIRSHRAGEKRLGALAAFIVLAALLLALTPALAARSGRAALAQGGLQPGQALVRIVHASPDAGEVDVLVDDRPVATNLAFGQASDFLALPDGTFRFQVVPAGSAADAAVIDDEVDLDDGRAYEFVVANLLAEIESQTYEIDRERIEEPGSARVRVINLAPDAGEVDVAVAGQDEPLFDGLGFADASEYAEVAAGPLDLELRSDEDDAQVLLAAPGLVLEAGVVYDLLAIGQAGDGSLQLLTLTATTRLPCGEIFGVAADPEAACVRMVHVSPGAPNLDLYVDNEAEPLVANLGYGGATPEWLALPSGNHRFRVVPTGQPVDDALVDEEVELDAGDARDIVVLNILDEIELLPVELALSWLPAGQARLRVVHASPDAGIVDIGIGGGDPVYQAVQFEDETEHIELDATTYDLELRNEDGQVVLAWPDVALEAGYLYHAYLIGQAADQSLALLILPAPTVPAPPDVPPTGPDAATPGA
jgi:hypothetical protein